MKYSNCNYFAYHYFSSKNFMPEKLYYNSKFDKSRQVIQNKNKYKWKCVDTLRRDFMRAVRDLYRKDNTFCVAIQGNV